MRNSEPCVELAPSRDVAVNGWSCDAVKMWKNFKPKPSGYWIKTTDTGEQKIQLTRVSNRKLEETFLIQVLVFNSGLLLWRHPSQLSLAWTHTYSEHTHLNIYKTNWSDEAQTNIFTGCISLHHSCSRFISSVHFQWIQWEERKKINKCCGFFLPTLTQCQIQNVMLKSLRHCLALIFTLQSLVRFCSCTTL